MTDQKEKISNLISSDDVVLFMKGTPDFPQCGFSANVIGILNYFGVKFTSFNVLEDNELREGPVCAGTAIISVIYALLKKL